MVTYKYRRLRKLIINRIKYYVLQRMTTVNLTDFKYFSVYTIILECQKNSDRVHEMKLKFLLSWEFE